MQFVGSTAVIALISDAELKDCSEIATVILHTKA
jgi:hypothetical protein